MKEMYKAFMKKLFGADYERLKKTLLVYMVVFGGLYTDCTASPVSGGKYLYCRCNVAGAVFRG